MAGTYRGRDELLGVFRRFAQLLGAPPRLTTHDVTSSADHVVELAVNAADRGGRAFEWRAIRVYHVRDGLVREIWVVLEDQYAVDEYLE